MAKMIKTESKTYPIFGLKDPVTASLDQLQKRACECREVAITLVDQVKYALEIDDVERVEAYRAIHDVELVRSAIYDVGAVLLEELQGITARLEKLERRRPSGLQPPK